MWRSRQALQKADAPKTKARSVGYIVTPTAIRTSPLSTHICTYHGRIPLKRYSAVTYFSHPKRKRSYTVVSSNLNENGNGTVESGKFEPVEDGVLLPQIESSESLEAEGKWLQQKLTTWLDQEWEQGEPQPIHVKIGHQTAQIYKRQRMEGENDLSSILIAIGSELEGMDFSSSFIGPWNVANKAAEFLLEHRAGPRVKQKPYVPASDAPKWSMEMEKERRRAGEKSTETAKFGRPYPPHLVDYFEKLKFLSEVLGNEAPKEVLDGAVAVAVGYKYDADRKAWDGKDVEDDYFKQFGNVPPDVLGDESVPEFTDTLKHLEKQLRLDEDEDGHIAQGLETFIETIHGKDLTDIQMGDKEDHSFHKRVVAVKWLHLCGGF